jgi:ribonucleoside-diphosphate reductase alpha chain
MKDSSALEEAQRQFDTATKVYQEAQKQLGEALRAMHKQGVYPPPPKNELRFRLPSERDGKTHVFGLGIDGDRIKAYITTGVYSDGTPGEIFLVADKQGSFVSGLMDCFATLISISLQHGIPLQRMIDKFRWTRFEPSGMSRHPEVRSATSVVDYIMQWLNLKYLTNGEEKHDGQPKQSVVEQRHDADPGPVQPISLSPQ